ncbi:FecCD family ABC transporter permease [Glutamicibacter sp.]|uniref:FecCD family ABC transporter permease n=1 Tax=Glutamicibacter sp. TaxID=1931995 RepID=UPI002FE0D5EC
MNHDAVASQLNVSQVGKANTEKPKTLSLTAGYVRTVLALAVVFLLSLCLGSKSLSISDLLQVINGTASTGDQQIVFGLRLARSINGVLVGLALGASGAIMQSVIRNPIADPGILGINAGAALGVAIGILVLGSAGMLASIAFSLGGAAIAALFLFACASMPSFRDSAVRITLCGVAFSAVLAGITQMLILSDEHLLDQFRFWQVGSLTARPIEAALWVGPIILFGTLLAWLIGQRLNILDLGDESSNALGASASWSRARALIVVALLCGPATALAGPVAFVGFAVPHLVRLVYGNNTKQVIRFSALLAPVLLLLCDIAGRLVGNGAEVQVGIMTAIIGSVMLIVLILRPSTKKLS